MTIDREWLQQNAIFQFVKDSVFEEFLEQAQERTYSDGEIIFTEMEQFGDILLVVEGCLNHQFALTDFDEDPEELIANPGEFSNLVRFISDAPTPLSCVAKGNVKALYWKNETWTDICSRHPDIGYKIAVKVGAELVQRLLRINQLLLDNVSWGLD